jgi:signal peptidase
MKFVIKFLKKGLFIILVLLSSLYITTSINSFLSKDKIPSVFGYLPMTVLTGSMLPYINPGDMIIDKKINYLSVNLGDVITYSNGEAMLITHRVVDIVNEGEVTKYKTKGDANNSEDSKLVSQEQIVGKYVFKIPYAGYISHFARSIYGYIILILIPAFLLVWDQVKAILSEIKSNKNNKDKSNDSMDI